MSKQPNIVLIFTDNQQASTLGCYGNTEIHTPHLNKLASTGVTFDNAFCPNAFCSPCRASLLTGLLPSQHGIHSWIDDRNMQEWPQGWHALNGMTTLPELLKDNGYATALIGKYHLGDPTSPASGFDNWVTLEDGHIRSFYRNKIFDNGKVYEQPGHSVDYFTDKAQSFIKTSATNKNPFFLYLPYPAPYGHWPATRETDTCRFTDHYKDCPMNSIPRQALDKKAVDGFLWNHKESTEDLDFSMLMRAPNDLATLRNYYSQISMVDDGVGRIMSTLSELNIEDDTIVIFTSDHGLSVGQHGFWGHGGACFPSNMHHAAHSIPLIIKHNNLSQQGNRNSTLVSNMDLYATIVDAVGLDNIDNKKPLPSRSLMPLLEGSDALDCADDAIYAEQEETRVIRTGRWVLFKRFNQSPDYPLFDELFDVYNDPSEQTNLAGIPEYAETEQRLSDMIQAYFAQYSEPKSNLWAGGVPIQNSMRKSFWRSAWGEDWAPVYSYTQD